MQPSTSRDPSPPDPWSTPLVPLDLDLVDLPPAEALHALVARFVAREHLTDEQGNELVRLFGVPPSGEGSGLDDEDTEHFVHATIQALETCLLDRDRAWYPFVNQVVQHALDQVCLLRGTPSTVLRTVCDEDRRGADRRMTFGQVKSRPDDPSDPSFFGGLWLANSDGSTVRVLFTIHADAEPDSIEVNPVELSGVEGERLEKRVRARGPHSWRLQVEEDSDLGRWIAGLAGTDQIGQIRGHIPLGVLCDAVRRAIEPRGIHHLLLGASRRDAPGRPWHTGDFLVRIEDEPRFEWRGVAIDTRTDRLVVARCIVAARAEIVDLLPSQD